MRVVWTASARRDLREIWTYIVRDNPAAAERVDGKIIAAGRSLTEMPRRGRPGRRTGTRELIVSGRPYIIVYTLRGETVAILRVVHMAQDWPPRRR